MTTIVSQDDVLHLAQLSSLQLSNDEIASLQIDLENIIQYFELLGELDTSGVEPTYQVTDLENVFRNDEIVESNANRDILLKLSPDQKYNQIKVPKVL
ncbi:MAG: Asp-tRNA(Asn)/Glu-tRNA(Gln) amidotransferase subunit GatC [Candidatus Saccharimonadales bacterium]